MKHRLSVARFAGVMVVLVLISAGCAPMPIRPPSLTPTASVSAPGVGKAEPGASPLQPTTALTGVAPGSTGALLASPDPAAATATLAPSATPAPTLVGPGWKWASSTFTDGAVLAPSDPARYTFQLLGDGNAIVQADCNFGTGTYEESGASFSFSGIGTTKVACPPDSLSSAFVAQLLNVESAGFEGIDLLLSLKDGAGTMRLQAVAAEAVAEAEPTETAIPSVVTSSSVTPPTAAPSSPTQASPVPPTETPAPPTTTPLPIAAATPVLLATPAPGPTGVVTATVLPSLNETQWLLVSLTVNGQATPPIEITPVTLEIAADGSRISGSTGCNRYGATFSKDVSGAVVLGPALTTQNTCGATSMVQEVRFIDALLRVRSYVVQGNELRMIDSAGQDLLVFVRK